MRQTERAEGRLKSLTEMYDLFVRAQTTATPTILNCIQQQLLSGCFGLYNVKSEESCTQYHYLEGIESSPVKLQEGICTVVHNIYKLLVSSLRNRLENSDNRQLQLIIIFSLCTRYVIKGIRPERFNLNNTFSQI